MSDAGLGGCSSDVVAMSRHVIAALLVLASAARADTPKLDEDEGTPKLSLPTEADRVAWQKSGFRLGIALAYGRFAGLRGAPSGRLLGPVLHAGLRLDKSWSLLSTFEYASASARGGLSGLRFAGTIDPTWHVTPSFAVAIGFGFGGIAEGRTGRPEASPTPGEVTDASYTFPSATMPLPSCSGVGAAALARASYSWVMGPRSSLVADLDVIAQYTKCVAPTGRLDPDNATAIVREQYWPHTGATLSLGVTWR